MSLSQAQRAMVEKARSIGGGGQGVALSEGACAYILATIVSDLDVKEEFSELPSELPPFYGEHPVGALEVRGVPFLQLLDRLVNLVPDADTYFLCLAKLHKARLKYERILMTQPIPTIEQVGPRALLEYGKLSPRGLCALLFWRKWIFDIDNRAAQETGYLFEPIIASAIGGVSVSASRSPIRRHDRPAKGRQVDCIRDDRAFEFKLRVTIAASGQGRWREELDFPYDCRNSGFIPVLIVLDPTPNPKLAQLCEAFEYQNGEVYIGNAAWDHLSRMAGPTMAAFLNQYVHGPIQELLQRTPQELPPVTFCMQEEHATIRVGNESFTIIRESRESLNSDRGSLPEDADEEVVGP